jgi:O-antigen biosynthesis protein
VSHSVKASTRSFVLAEATPAALASELVRLAALPPAHWRPQEYDTALALLAAIEATAPMEALQLPNEAWALLRCDPAPEELAPVFVRRLAAQYAASAAPPAGLVHPVRRATRSAKAWAGQLILRSRLHSTYLRFRRLMPLNADADFQTYQQWIAREQSATPPAQALKTTPTITLLLPVHDPPVAWLAEAVESVRSQSYPHWELRICDDASKGAAVKDYLRQLPQLDSRIHVTTAAAPLGISGALMAAAANATGSYLAALDHDDRLAPQALAWIAQAAQDPAADLIYTDEDFIDEQGRRRAPHFKPSWSPALLDGCMFLGHLVVVSRTLFDTIGGYRSAYDSAQDFDLALRATEQARLIVHIPHVAYHWRMHDGSVAADRANKSFTHTHGLRALNDAVARRGWRGTQAIDSGVPNLFLVRSPSENTNGFDIVLTRPVTGHLPAGLAGLMDDAQIFKPKAGPHQAEALNQAAAQGTAPAILFLDPSLEPSAGNWSQLLLRHLVQTGGIAGGLVKTGTGLLQDVGLVLGANGCAAPIGQGTPASSRWLWLDAAREVSAVSLGCLAVQRKVFDQLGGFDSSLPPELIDVDLCLRLQQSGGRVTLDPKASFHLGSPVPAPLPNAQGWLRFLVRWRAQLTRPDPFFSANLALINGEIRL